MEMRNQINDKMRRILCFCVAWLGLCLAMHAQTSTLTTQAVAIAQGKEAQLHVTLANETDISGGQFTMTLTQGITVNEVTLNDERSNGHSLEYRVNGNAVRILFYAQPTAAVKGSDGVLCTLSLAADMEISGEHKIAFSDVKLAADAITTADVRAIDGSLIVTSRFMVSVDASVGGSVDGGGLFDAGSTATVTATAEAGYHFVQWSDGVTDNPYTFTVEQSVDLTAEFAPNAYDIIYVVDGVEYKRETVLYGSTIDVVDAPTKEGYTFSGWIGVPDTMPAGDVTVTGSFVTNGYTVTYIIDGEVFHTEVVAYGAAVVAPNPPTKEGYTFGGWEGVPETMPAKDITVTGSFVTNGYTVTYIIDGEEFHTETVAYGAAVVAPEAPTKKGYTFGGWEGVPDTMPANDITITGHFIVNEYTLTYTVEGEVYKSVTYKYGSAIVSEEEPAKEGYTFSGWIGVPDTMPAEDVTVTGHFTINVYQVTYVVEGEVYHTDYVTYGMTVATPDYPTKEGYTFGGWEGVPATMPAKDVTIVGTFILNEEQTDAQGVVYVLNEAKDAFEVSGYTDTLKSEVAIPSELYGLPIKAVHDKAFYHASDLVSLLIPASVERVGALAFGECEQLLVVEWYATAALHADCFAAPAEYGNMLVYVSDSSLEIGYTGNVIVDGIAEHIELIDGLPLRNIHEFTARSISYSHDFARETHLGTSSGWEALVLPFDVQRVVSESRGELKPFGEADFTTSLPYWVAELQDDGEFALVDKISASVPFIMEVPNSEEYEDIYNVEGTITFSAENAMVYSTVSTQPAVGDYTLMGCYEGTVAANNVYALNDDEYAVDGEVYMPGGVFVANSRDIRPFEAYVYSNNASAAPYLRIGGKGTNGIGHTTLNAQPSAMYDLTGRKVLKTEVKKGIYINNGRKIVVK